MGCANSPQKLWEVSLPDDTGNSYIETDISGVATAVANSENGLLVKRKIMTAGEYFNLPEFKGF